MYLTLLKAKIHRATVTAVEPDYDGSCAIDADLLTQAGILDGEQVDVYNVTNGDRLTTYAITAPAGSGMLSLNGAAAHRADAGDLVIVCAYAMLETGEVRAHVPVVVHVDRDNRSKPD